MSRTQSSGDKPADAAKSTELPPEVLEQIEQAATNLEAANTRATEAEGARDQAVKDLEAAKAATTKAEGERDQAVKDLEAAKAEIEQLKSAAAGAADAKSDGAIEPGPATATSMAVSGLVASTTARPRVETVSEGQLVRVVSGSVETPRAKGGSAVAGETFRVPLAELGDYDALFAARTLEKVEG